MDLGTDVVKGKNPFSYYVIWGLGPGVLRSGITSDNIPLQTPERYLRITVLSICLRKSIRSRDSGRSDVLFSGSRHLEGVWVEWEIQGGTVEDRGGHFQGTLGVTPDVSALVERRS